MFKPLVSVQIGEIAGHIYEHLPLQIGGETPGRQRASEIFSVSLDDISTHPAILPLFGLWPQSMQYESVFGTVVERSALLSAGVGGAEGVVPADGEQTLQRGFGVLQLRPLPLFALRGFQTASLHPSPASVARGYHIFLSVASGISWCLPFSSLICALFLVAASRRRLHTPSPPRHP